MGKANDIGQEWISVAAILWLSAATPASTQQNETSAGGGLFEKVQSAFAEAYSRHRRRAARCPLSGCKAEVVQAGRDFRF